MVVASVPLWVVHSSSVPERPSQPNGGAGAGAGLLPGGTAAATAAAAAAASTAGSGTGAAEAERLLALGAGPGSRRAPVYSCDVHPAGTRFATAGGDGRVKIWGLGRVFAEASRGGGGGASGNGSGNGDGDGDGDGDGKKTTTKKLASFDGRGRYLPSESSSGASAVEESADEQPKQRQQQQQQQGTTTITPPTGDAVTTTAPAPAPVSAGASTSGPAGTAKMMTVTSTKDGKKRKRAVLLSTVPFDADATADAIAPGPATAAGGSQLANGAGAADGSTASTAGGAPTSSSSFSSQVGNIGSPPRGDAPGAVGGKGDGRLARDIEAGTQNQLLCTLSSHSGSVLSVRWSSSGTYLASAGDDALVLIYARSARPPHPAGGGGGNLVGSAVPDVEHWSRIRICRGHNLDVVGLAWSPDDSHLVSCSLDSAAPICVWRLNLNNSGGGGAVSAASPARFGSPSRSGSVGGGASASAILVPYKTLSASNAGGSEGEDGHTSTVKGVAFDPTGKYLASSGDDPSVCIWRAYDDWGLEAKIDQKDGIFGTPTTAGSNGAKAMEEQQQLASLSLFRRISFSPDGVHVCVTNATVKGKPVASTVSRDGWRTANEKPPPMGAANLVGHKAAVVISRHCPYFIDAKKVRKRPGGGAGSSSDSSEESSEDENTEPKYATLLALGDKRGFVTVWSTAGRRPIFKAQVSESRCTVTDLSWALMPSSQSLASDGPLKKFDMVLLISLLDGHLAALRFGMPDELGSILPEAHKNKIFRLKYGINLRECLATGRMVDSGADKPRLIENALQLTLEEEGMGGEVSSSDEDDRAAALRRQIDDRAAAFASGAGAKKRSKPVLMSTSGARTSEEEGDIPGESDGQPSKKKKKNLNDGDSSINSALSSAARAAETAEHLSKRASSNNAGGEEKKDEAGQSTSNNGGSSLSGRHPHPPQDHHINRSDRGTGRQAGLRPVMSAPNQRVFSVDLPLLQRDSDLISPLGETNEDSSPTAPLVADCSNISIANSSSGRAQGQVPSINLTISQHGQVKYRETILGATATALAATESMLAIGTFDGTIYLYGTSPTIGWKSALAFRCHAPIVVGGSVVRLNLCETSSAESSPQEAVEMLVVTANGDFGLYKIVPKASLAYRGTVLPPMEHMRLSTNDVGAHRHKSRPQEALPEIARITITDSGRLLLLLSYSSSSATASSGSAGSTAARQRGGTTGGAVSISLPGGSIQAFVYDHDLKLWVRVSDSRFVLSDFYDDAHQRGGPLTKIESVTRAALGRAVGLSSSSLYRQGNADGAAATLRETVSRSHCEDRMACALALASKAEFEHWLGLYVHRLAQDGNDGHLRLLVDMLLGKNADASMGAGPDDVPMDGNGDSSFCWWLSSAESILGMDRKTALRKIVLPEMSKNRGLQRLTNEVATELTSL
jgi:protein HIRA/HIR1